MTASPSTPKVSAWLLKPAIAALRARGLSLEPLLHASGLKPVQVEVPNEKIERSAAIKLLEEAVLATNEPAFGLLAAEFYQPGANVFDYAGVTSPTVEAALTRVCRYARLVDDALLLKLELQDPLAMIVFRALEGQPTPRVLTEYLLGVGIIAARQWVGFSFPMEVRFRHSAPADLTPYDRVIRGIVRFDAAHDALVFPKLALAVPVRSADPDLLPVLDEQAAKQLAATLSESMSLPERVRALLRSELPHGSPTSERMAERLHMSERTLRRRLSEHSTSMKEILDELRRELALTMLTEPRVTIEDVALRLGFSDATAFHRAFRRWTGRTPKAFQDDPDASKASAS
jgi:AraC-like DNA-binding protein